MWAQARWRILKWCPTPLRLWFLKGVPTSFNPFGRCFKISKWIFLTYDRGILQTAAFAWGPRVSQPVQDEVWEASSPFSIALWFFWMEVPLVSKPDIWRTARSGVGPKNWGTWCLPQTLLSSGRSPYHEIPPHDGGLCWGWWLWWGIISASLTYPEATPLSFVEELFS